MHGRNAAGGAQPGVSGAAAGPWGPGGPGEPRPPWMEAQSQLRPPSRLWLSHPQGSLRRPCPATLFSTGSSGRRRGWRRLVARGSGRLRGGGGQGGVNQELGRAWKFPEGWLPSLHLAGHGDQRPPEGQGPPRPSLSRHGAPCWRPVGGLLQGTAPTPGEGGRGMRLSPPASQPALFLSGSPCGSIS